MSESRTFVALGCSKCGNAIESMSGDPGLWAVWISMPGDNGEPKPYHAKCITYSISELDRLRAENARLVTDMKNLMETYRYDTGQLKTALEKARDALVYAKESESLFKYKGEAPSKIEQALTAITALLGTKEGEKLCYRCGEKEPCACEPQTQGKTW